MHSNTHCCHHHQHGHDSSIGNLMRVPFAIAGVVTRHAVNCMESLTAHLLPTSTHCASGSCTVPPPCWMPKSAGSIDSCSAPSAVCQLKLRISNDDYQTHTYDISAAGEYAALVSFSETALTLGPKESKTITVSFSSPALVNGCHGDHYNLLLWVKGCNEHYLTWQVKVSRCQASIDKMLALLSLSSCKQHCIPYACITDKVDYELQWYDHFYLQRHCCA